MIARPFLSRLAFRIYLIGLAQIAIVGLGFLAASIIEQPGPWRKVVILPRRLPTPRALIDYIADDVASSLGDPARLQVELSRVKTIPSFVTVVDESGATVTTNDTPGRARCWNQMPPDGARTTSPDGDWCVARRGVLEDGRRVYAELKFPPVALLSRVAPSAVGLALVVIAASSWLLGLSLARPLRRMSTAARAFGAGNLGARVRLERNDELGDVAHAFDEMAERVTDLLRAERELLANVSHELRTPLARIRVALDLASEGDTEVARESLADIAGDLEELEQLIGNVLAAARLDLTVGPSTIPPLDRQPVDVRDLVDRAASRFRSAHPARALVVDDVEAPVVVDGDPVLLRRALDNLLENANKYTEKPESGVELRVDASRDVRIRIVDHGVGISPDDLKKMFRPFFRADRSRTRATGGLGLGLLLARRIIEAHGGTVNLESELGRGTVATIVLPSRSSVV
jgi:signal transduction histidine kinase